MDTYIKLSNRKCHNYLLFLNSFTFSRAPFALQPLPAGGKSISRESDKSLISTDGSETEVSLASLLTKHCFLKYLTLGLSYSLKFNYL